MPDYQMADDKSLISVLNDIAQFPEDKEKNPWGIKNIPYDRPIVDFVDALVAIAKKNGSKDQVETSYDWNTLDFMYKGWKILYPKTSKEFEDHMREWRRYSNHLGISKEKGGAMLQHKFNLPMPLYQMIDAIFPKQKWDKKFVDEFARRFAMFAGSDNL